MISRCKPPALARSIASSATLPHKALTRAYEDKGESSDMSQQKPPTDPWAPIFDDIAPPARTHLPPRFFTSRPAPKTFFSSNVPRRQPRSSSSTGKRTYGTDARRGGPSRPPASRNSDNAPSTRSAWDHVFEGIDDSPHPSTLSPPTSAFPTPSARRPARRPPMTAREISAFDNMFDMIFTAVSKSRESGLGDTTGETRSDPDVDASSASTPTLDPAAAASSSVDPLQTLGDASPGEAPDLFGRLRRQSNRMRRTSATDELLDRQKEAMELCDTDQALLEWALRDVFPDTPSSPESELARYLATPTYPLVLAHLMRTFRTKYDDPHTALALFMHAKRRSVHSYVFGCTTPAYNELLETRWDVSRMAGLTGIEDALVEMRANGVSVDKRTRAIVERIRREVGETMLSRKREGEGEGEAEVWDVLARIEALVQKKGERGGQGDARKESRSDAKKRHWNEEWKTRGAGDLRLGEDRLSLA